MEDDYVPVPAAPQVAAAPADEREAFEAWWKSEYGTMSTSAIADCLRWVGDGYYRNRITGRQWFVWKAARAAAPEVAAQVAAVIPCTVDELAECIRRVDGNHTLGAGTLAEEIVSWMVERGAAPGFAAPQPGTLRFDLSEADWFKNDTGPYPLYQCLDCRQQHYGPTRVEHKPGCRVAAALADRAAQAACTGNPP